MTDAAPTGYPQHWEADVLLTDGGAVHLRPAAVTDGPAILAMHERMSERTRYLRYFQAVAHLSPQQLAVFTDVDHVSSVGLVAELGGDIIAAGSYHRDPQHPDTAEVAFVVQDAQQRRGLGSVLLEHLAAAAQERGIRRFTAEVLGENQSMLRVFIDAGYAVTREFSSGIIDLGFDHPADGFVVGCHHRARAASRGPVDPAVVVSAVGGGDRRVQRDPQARARGAGQPVERRVQRTGVPGSTRKPFRVQGVRAYRSVLDIPDPVDVAVVTVPAASVAEVLESCRAKGVARVGHRDRRLRRCRRCR